MSRWRQPWERVDIDGVRCHLQILDPATAFEMEPELVRVLGETLALACAAPHEIIGAVWRSSVAGWIDTAQDLRTLATDAHAVPGAATDAIVLLGRILGTCLTEADLRPAWVISVFGRLIYGRLKVNGEVVETAADYAALNFRPMAKWQLMAAQIKQSFGPLWLRSPYNMRSKIPAPSYGVPQPKDVPLAVRWADNLARLGSAGSSREILHEWTPVEMIEVVENAAYQAEFERRATAPARSGE